MTPSRTTLPVRVYEAGEKIMIAAPMAGLAPEDIAAVASWLSTQPVLGKAVESNARLPLDCGSVSASPR